MQKHASNIQNIEFKNANKYARNMQEICKKYARNMQTL